jgi:signal transduction histidine kinase
MTDKDSAAIAFVDFPDPVIAYAIERGEPRITAMNEDFASVFNGVAPEDPVAEIFDRFDVVNSTGAKGPLTHLNRGDRVDIYLDSFGKKGPFFGRVLSSGEDTGYLVFSDLTECLDIAEAPAIDQVSSVISHDLRNPLDVAEAHLQAARETGKAEHFDAVANAHERMEQIIRDVLTITRDRTAVSPSDSVSIEAAAKDAWRSVDTEQARLDVTDSLPTTTADADRVQRLFENLFRNSVEHGLDIDNQSVGREQGKGKDSGDTATITVGALEDGFYVADNGPGIPPAKRDLVFDPGYSTRDGGTGLGLAIVERIVSAHDWELTLSTGANCGARFEIRF